MTFRPIALQARTGQLLADLEALDAEVDPGERAQQIYGGMVRSCRQMHTGCRHACASGSPADFIARISVVAQHARRTKASLMLLTQLGYVSIEAARASILEARGLENIFVASRNTAKRRHAGRAAVAARIRR